MAATCFLAATLTAGILTTLWQARIALRGWGATGRAVTEAQRQTMLLPLVDARTRMIVVMPGHASFWDVALRHGTDLVSTTGWSNSTTPLWRPYVSEIATV